MIVIPLLGVKTRCADKSTAENYEHTYSGRLRLELFCYHGRCGLLHDSSISNEYGVSYWLLCIPVGNPDDPVV